MDGGRTVDSDYPGPGSLTVEGNTEAYEWIADIYPIEKYRKPLSNYFSQKLGT